MIIERNLAMQVYVNKERIGVKATGIYDTKTGELVVLKGSVVSPTISESKSSRAINPIKKKREASVKNGKTICDMKFKSPSTAANFVMGRSSNGYEVWCDEKGIKLGVVLGRNVSKE